MAATEKVFSYTSNELEDLINKALINALPGIRENVDIGKIGKEVSKAVLSFKKSEERSFDDMTVIELKQWAKNNDIYIPERYHSKDSLVKLMKRKKKKMDEQKSKLELVWNSKRRYYTDENNTYVYTEDGIVIAKLMDEKIKTLKKKDEKIFEELGLEYELLSSGDVTRKLKSIRAEKESLPSPSPPPSPPPPPSPSPSPPPSPPPSPKRKEPIATIENIDETPPPSPREDLYKTDSETEDIGGEGVITSEKEEEDIDVIDEIEKELDNLVEKDPPISEKEYTQFITALIVKNITPASIPKLAKASGLNEDKTADILMSLTELNKKFPNVQKEIRARKSEIHITSKEKSPIVRKFRK